MSHEAFEADVQAGFFVETVTYKGERYGVSARELHRALATKAEYLLCVVTMEGADALAEAYQNTVKVAIAPPEADVLARRMRARGDAETTIQNRLSTYQQDVDALNAWSDGARRFTPIDNDMDGSVSYFVNGLRRLHALRSA